jgi:S-adenosylmethionine-diacylglycerol 3-amino-3-carboxypropyl transferase
MQTPIVETADAWAREAASLPIAFSQVREDPALDKAIVEELAPNARVFMIASGGDTAAALAASGSVSHLRLVDINPAQLALTRLKLHLLLHAGRSERLAILGHLPMTAAERAEALDGILNAMGLSKDSFGPRDLVARVGPDQAGRYEILFHHLRQHLHGHRDELLELLALSEPSRQAERPASETSLGRVRDAAFDSVMRMENLVCLFGREATRNAQRSFARHFAAQTRRALAAFPARTNPFLNQLLQGSFHGGDSYDWFDSPPPRQWPEIVCQCSTAIEALAALPPESVDFVHLSNILDWLSPEDAAKTLALAWEALRFGGLTIIRQLNSTLDIPACEARFRWRAEQAEFLHRKDRSFFYRKLFIGEKSRRT